MKKILFSLVLFSLILINTKSVNAMTYEEALSSPKPMALLIYASWADDLLPVQQAYNGMMQQYGEQYNFVPLDIASNDAKAFNKTYHIYPNLPYVLLFKDHGKISRYLQKNCILDNACFSERLKMFIN